VLDFPGDAGYAGVTTNRKSPFVSMAAPLPILVSAGAAPSGWLNRGAAFYEAQHRQLQIKHLKSKAAKLGFQIIQVPAA
jgi:hypothetical protein